MGANKGFIKEREVVSILNNKALGELDSNYKNNISKIFLNLLSSNDILRCFKNEGVGLEKKNDLTIEAKNKKINLSVKIGTGNSLHQESIYSFTSFLDSKVKLSKIENDLIYEFHWCDGSLDNTGSFLNRKSKAEYKNINSKNYKTYISVLRKYKYEIFSRVMLGSVNQPNYLLYFKNFENKIPYFISMKDLLLYHLNNEISENHIGIFTLQNCNLCLKGQDHGNKNHICVQGCPKHENEGKKHRNDIQFKMINIKSNFL